MVTYGINDCLFRARVSRNRHVFSCSFRRHLDERKRRDVGDSSEADASIIGSEDDVEVPVSDLDDGKILATYTAFYFTVFCKKVLRINCRLSRFR